MITTYNYHIVGSISQTYDTVDDYNAAKARFQSDPQYTITADDSVNLSISVNCDFTVSG